MTGSEQWPHNQELNVIRRACFVVSSGTRALFFSFIIVWHIALECTISQACKVTTSLDKGEFYFLSFGRGDPMLLWVMWENVFYNCLILLISCICFPIKNMACLSRIQNLRQSLTFLGIWISLMRETVRNWTEVLIPIDRACEVSVSEHSHSPGIRGLESIHFLVCINSCYQKVIIS